VGKELAARAIHAQSHRREKPFVSVNCGALPEALKQLSLTAQQILRRYSFQEKFFGVILHMLVLSHHKSRRGA
jgi:transcriptional regulator of aromatic amino acid metabolism